MTSGSSDLTSEALVKIEEPAPSVASVASVAPGVPEVPGRVEGRQGSQNSEVSAVMEAARRRGTAGPLTGRLHLSELRSRSSRHFQTFAWLGLFPWTFGPVLPAVSSGDLWGGYFEEKLNLG